MVRRTTTYRGEARRIMNGDGRKSNETRIFGSKKKNK
jgi:hypothetical protein